jgi:glycyl-tRNA synthetase beta subunit
VERDDWMDLLNAYGRCIRIVRDQRQRFEFQPDADPEPATAALRNAYEVARTQIQPESDVDRLLTALRPMVPAINRFFDDVLVMHEDESLRASRLGLLQDIWALSRGIVHVTRLEGF